MKEPIFALSRNKSSIVAYGAAQRFNDAAAVASLLRSGAVPVVVGAIPFDPCQPAALTVPRACSTIPGRFLIDEISTDYLSPVDTQPPPNSVRRSYFAQPRAVAIIDAPSRREHRQRVSYLSSLIHEGRMNKVVAARAVDVQLAEPVNPVAALDLMVRSSPTGNGFLADLSPAGPQFLGHKLFGSSPELLVQKAGSTVKARPLAGSCPRGRDTSEDALLREALAASVKNKREHAFVVDQISETLGPLCRSLYYPSTPTVTSTRELWHLATPFEGTLKDDHISALDLALALHPTAAVAGIPTSVALSTIRQVEEPRRFYAGAVGWVNADGDGEWMVSLRCAEMAPDYKSFRAWAGGGIVADSDPDDEVDETTTKLSTVLRALGLESPPSYND